MIERFKHKYIYVFRYHSLQRPLAIRQCTKGSSFSLPEDFLKTNTRYSISEQRYPDSVRMNTSELVLPGRKPMFYIKVFFTHPFMARPTARMINVLTIFYRLMTISLVFNDMSYQRHLSENNLLMTKITRVEL